MNFTCLLLADNANVQRFNTYIETQRKQFRVKTMLTSILNVQGEVLVTGSCTSEIGYFRIRLNPYDSVETVTCVNKKTFEVQKMVALYGKHESMLNELKYRFRVSTAR